MSVDKVDVLKIDQDVFVDPSWIMAYTREIIWVCKLHGVNVTWIKMCRSKKKGLHFYIKIYPKIEAELANRLQWLLGDDCQRVDFDRARIDSDLNEWNKLFEKTNVKLKTIYRNGIFYYSNMSVEDEVNTKTNTESSQTQYKQNKVSITRGIA